MSTATETVKPRYAVGLTDYDLHETMDVGDTLADAKDAAKNYARDLAGSLVWDEPITVKWYVWESASGGTSRADPLNEADDWRTVATGAHTTRPVRDRKEGDDDYC